MNQKTYLKIPKTSPVTFSLMTLQFQAFSWYVDDGTVDKTDYANMNFTVHVFGKTRIGESVAVHVTGYNPSFCVKFDKDNSTIDYYEQLTKLLRDKELVDWSKEDKDGKEVFVKSDTYEDHLLEPEEPIPLKKSLWGFQNNTFQPFFKFEFKSLKAYNKILSIFRACSKLKYNEEDAEIFYEEWKAIKTDDGYDAAFTHLQETAQDLFDNLKAKDPEADDRDKYALQKALKWITKLGNANIPFDFATGSLFEVVDPILRFAHIRKLKMSGWINITEYFKCTHIRTTCQIELDTTYENLQSIELDDICPYIKEMAFDIESYSHNDLFPDPNDPQNYCYQIGITLKNYADKNIRRVLLHCRTPLELRGSNSGLCLDIPDTQVENFENERELLIRFSDIIRTEDPDFIEGYNSDIFDWNYLMTRAKLTGTLDHFEKLSRLLDYTCKLEAKKFQSSAYGDNVYMRIDMPGRINVDLMIWIQRNMPVDRYPDYKLDTIAEKEIGENKRDVDAKAIFSAFRSGNPEECTVIGEYCCQDTVLVQKLVIKLDVVTQMFEMSNITCTPAMYLLQKGQQIKVFSQISRVAMAKDFFVPVADDRENDSFKGAIVLEPKTGMYTTPVSVLDFASLYPSIQVAYKVCYTTIVLVQCANCKKGYGKCLKSKNVQCFDNLQGVEYSTIEWDDSVIEYKNKETGARRIFSSVDDCSPFGTKTQVLANIKRNDDSDTITFRNTTIHHRYRFAQNSESVIPDLQTELKKSRKAVKRMMAPIEHSKDPDDQLRYRVLNGRQLAIKVSMNSIYGFTSAFMLNLMALSASVTAKGRQMIEQTKDFMEKEFESIAFKEIWTKEDETTWYTKEGRQVVSQIKESEDWIRKFPSAVAGEKWTTSQLAIDVVGGDTDSVFCNFPRSSLAEAISLCHKAEVILTDEIFNRAPIEMEYEKTYLPMVIVKKKNYVGLKYEMDDERWKMDFKGIAVKRRNYCPFVKKVFWNVIYPALGVEEYTKNGKTLLKKAEWDTKDGADKAIESLEASLQSLQENKVLIDDLVMSASLKSKYKSENLPHIQLAKRMKERDAGSAPQSGQRFGYIIVNDWTRSSELSAKSEDPKYAKENKLEPDLLFYLNQQVRKPVCKFLSLIGKQKEADAVFESIQKTLFMQLKKKRQELANIHKIEFLQGKPVKSIAPLKAPKKPVTRQEKADKLLGSTKKITDFFK